MSPFPNGSFWGSLPKLTARRRGRTRAPETWPTGSACATASRTGRLCGGSRLPHALERLPLISKAFASGELGIDKVVELTRFATAETEEHLIVWAQGVSCGRIREKETSSIGPCRKPRRPNRPGPCPGGTSTRTPGSACPRSSPRPTGRWWPGPWSAWPIISPRCPARIVRLRQLKYRDRECTFPGCGERRFTQAHHIVWWECRGPTDLDNLILVCSFHCETRGAALSARAV